MDDRREISLNELLAKIGAQAVEIDELRRLLGELRRQLEEAHTTIRALTADTSEAVRE